MHWTLLLLSLPTLALASFENTAIVRTVELGGALVHITTTYAVRALAPDAGTYTFSLSEEDAQRTSFVEARVKGQKAPLALEKYGFNPRTHSVLYAVTLPSPLGVNGTASLVLETVQTHATEPWPRAAAQKDEQLLRYSTDLFVVSPYATAVQRTRIKSSTPKIGAYTTPSGIDAFLPADASPVSRSGATLTYGPFHGVPESATIAFANDRQQRVRVQFGHDAPVLALRTLRRAAEVSHWGANLNIQDEIELHNGGPELKGHFSRLEHQSQAYFKKLSAHILQSLTLHLPADARDAYFTDLIGNVSTSHLRAAGAGAPSAQLELRPRYPLLGGWNYTFTLGWDAPLDSAARWDKDSGHWVVGVPVWTLVPGAVVDDARVKIVLPEGAEDVEVFPPFPPKSMTHETHISYLDTKGRPAVIFEYENLTDRHQGTIYVSYRVPFGAHLRKPVAVATAFFAMFALAIGVRRVDFSLQKKK